MGRDGILRNAADIVAATELPVSADLENGFGHSAEAGADVLYAPGLTKEADIRSIVQSVDRPVNVVMGLMNSPFDVAALSRIGVKRISVGSALARLAYGALHDAAAEMIDHGTFRYADRAAPYGLLNGLFAPRG